MVECVVLSKDTAAAMSEDDPEDSQLLLAPDELEILSTLGDEMEGCCDQLELGALHRAGDLLRRETESLKCARSIVEAQHRAEFLQRLSTIVTDTCGKLEAKMRVSLSITQLLLNIYTWSSVWGSVDITHKIWEGESHSCFQVWFMYFDYRDSKSGVNSPN